ncbi:MAG: 30S ribosomal protein S16 [Arcanobacterium sp.]|nr:30S ribosomal protein S16 [Arcanobacterium sp.]
MAVKIRLKRMGKIREPHYRVVVVDSRKKRDGRVIEEIGYYNPNTDPSVIDINSERAQYWLSVGAQPSEAVLAQLKITGDWQAVKGGKAESTLKVVEKKNVQAEREAAVKAVQDKAEKLRAEKAEAIAKAEAEAAKAAEEAQASETEAGEAADEAGAGEAEA